MHSEQAIIVLISFAAGCCAAVMAYLISYGEYSRHFPDKRRARRMAIGSAALGFSLFFGLGLILAIVLPHFV